MIFGLYVLLGCLAGICSGMFGIGGGTILIPILVYLFSFSQHEAQGTTLAAMIPPIGLLAAWRYWQAGNVNIPVALLICSGFFFGGYFGANLIQNVSEPLLRRLFGGFLLFVALHMIFYSKNS
jgi:uncharacterized protein